MSNLYRRARLPWRNCGIDRSARLREIMTGQGAIGEPFTAHHRAGFKESSAVGHFAIIEAIRLFIEVAEQMKRFNTYVSPFDRPLQERPEILTVVGVDFAIHVRFGMRVPKILT